MHTPPPAKTAPAFGPEDWLRIRDALRYVGRDLHHRSFAVDGQRRELLWQEMDRCLALADRIEADGPLPGTPADAAS
jgi:hypothetical protein